MRKRIPSRVGWEVSKGVCRVSAIAAMGFLLLVLTGSDVYPQAVSNSNQLTGIIEFTNENPDILVLLDPLGGDQGFTYAYVRADSIDVSPPLNHSTFPLAETATRTGYEITVESSAAGIVYRTTVEARLDSSGDRYLFQPAESAPVYPEPASDVAVNFRQCAGMLNIYFTNEDGVPVAVNGGMIMAYQETSAGSGQYRWQAQDFQIPNGSEEEYLAVCGNGSEYRVDVTYEYGTDQYSNKVRHLCQHFVTVGCDEIVEIECRIPLGTELGEIGGNVDMEGESEHQIRQFTRMRAFNGPLKNYRYDTVSASPSQGSFLLENLMPSNAESPARGYAVYGEMNFRTGYRSEYLRTPWMYGPYNGDVYVEAGKRTDMGDTFVMSPGYVVGDILLAGPPGTEDGSYLQDLYRDGDRDYDNNGIPDEMTIHNSNVSAYGTGSKGSGGTMFSWGGLARVGFEGSVNNNTGDFLGDYEMVLGGLKREVSVWRPNALTLKFINRETPDEPETYQYSWLQLTNQSIDSQEIVPGETIEVDHSYCMSQVNLSYQALSGTLYAPQARGYGRFHDWDFEGNPANYGVSLSYANGTPTSLGAASDRGFVTMTLPQGNYTLTPTIRAVNPGGGTSNTELPPVTIDVGCSQVVYLTTELQVTLDKPPQETTEGEIEISGSVSGEGTIVEIFQSQNQEPEVLICADCGEDPDFSFDVTLEAGDNEITVWANDDLGNEASVTAFISYTPSAVEPAITVVPEPGDIVVAGVDDNTLDPCSTEPFLTVHLVSGQSKQYSWQHGFMPGQDALSHPDVSPDKGLDWYSYTSPNLMDLVPGVDPVTGMESAKPEYIVGVWVGGNGWDFQGRADNVVLLGIDDETIVPNLIENGTFDEGFAHWEKVSSKKSSNPSQAFWNVVPEDGQQGPSFDFRRIDSMNDGGSVGVLQRLNQSVIGWESLVVSYDAKVMSNTLSDSGRWWKQYRGWGETPCRVVVQYLTNTGTGNIDVDSLRLSGIDIDNDGTQDISLNLPALGMPGFDANGYLTVDFDRQDVVDALISVLATDGVTVNVIVTGRYLDDSALAVSATVTVGNYGGGT